MKNWRPDDWEKIKKLAMPELSLRRGEYAEFHFEAGADAMYKAIMEARPSDGEIRVRIIEALYGAVSIPDFEKWLKEKLLLKP